MTASNGQGRRPATEGERNAPRPATIGEQVEKQAKTLSIKPLSFEPSYRNPHLYRDHFYTSYLQYFTWQMRIFSSDFYI